MPQIDENKLNEYADAVFDRCNYFNDYVLETIGRRIKATGQLSAADQAALKNMADISGDMDAITKKLAEITGQNIADIEAIYTQVLTDGVNTYEPLYDLKGMTFLPFEQNEFAKQLVRHWAAETAGELVNLSRTKALCFDRYNLAGEVIGSTPLAGAFQKAIDDAVIAVSTGTVDFNTAMRKTVEQLGGSGVKVHYGSGVNRSLSAMVRQNLLYGAKRASQAYEEQVGKELGCDGFEVDYHAHPRPSHAFMGGRMYSYKGTVRIGGRVYEDGAEALERLSDYGCLHFKTDVILGISEPRYDEAWLSEQKRKDAEPIAFDGRQKTAYEWQQVQRELERAVRRENSTAVMARASGDKVLARRCREKTAAYREKYDALCDAVGLEKRYNRMAAYGAKAVDKTGGRGIIGEDIQISRSLGAAAFRDDILLPNGRRGKIQEGGKITKVVTFAGKGTQKELRVAKHLEKQYNVPASEWQHTRGDGYVVCDDGITRHAELHWFESKETGRIKMKVKRYFDDES